MDMTLRLYNSLSRAKEEFKPMEEGYIGLYVCGPTVYSDVHLGNCRTFVSFDIIYRFLVTLGYRVRYVRNITDVGHLLDDGEDRLSKGARLEQLEPMEVAQKYTVGFHHVLNQFNCKSPSIEPRASGHIMEQINIVQQIMDRGLAYESNGSVYFDTVKYNDEGNDYGLLSGRKIDELMSESRDDLKNQSEKRNPVDFALWMKADDSHIMKWASPWSLGFPGWHLECSAMSTKYLGPTFDIHGGGNDLKFPHHENEIAQNVASCAHQPARYWLHTNMLLMNGKKMSKSDGNTISPEELFSGASTHVSKGYDPMVVRFFMLQTHYRSTMDLTDEALLASEKGYLKLMQAWQDLEQIKTDVETGDVDSAWIEMMDAAFSEMLDDFNTPKALAKIFELVSAINTFVYGDTKQTIGSAALADIVARMRSLIGDIFGLASPLAESANAETLDQVMNIIMELRADARDEKDWSTSDKIRDRLEAANIEIKDGKDKARWQFKA